MEKKKCPFKKILLIIGAIVALAGIAYAVYRFFVKDDFDDFDEDYYVDEDDIADLLEEDE